MSGLRFPTCRLFSRIRRFFPAAFALRRGPRRATVVAAQSLGIGSLQGGICTTTLQ
jgi:hypothetical protein